MSIQRSCRLPFKSLEIEMNILFLKITGKHYIKPQVAFDHLIICNLPIFPLTALLTRTLYSLKSIQEVPVPNRLAAVPNRTQTHENYVLSFSRMYVCVAVD